MNRPPHQEPSKDADSEQVGRLLVLALDPLTEATVGWIRSRADKAEIVLLDLDDTRSASPAPESWRQRAIREFFDPEQLRSDFLAFLDRWPTQTLIGHKTFDQLLSMDDGTSLWWWGPGSARHPDKGVFLQFRAVWLAARAIEVVQPKRVVLHCRDAAVTRAIASTCATSSVQFSVTPASANPESSPFEGRGKWLARSIAWVPGALIYRAVRTLAARVAAGRTREPAAHRSQPAVAFSSAIPRHLREESQGGEVWFWSELTLALQADANPPRIRYLPYTSSAVPGWRQAAKVWRRLRGDSRFAPIPESFLCLREMIPAAARQLRRLFAYAALEKSEAYRHSFNHRGCDLSGLYVPLLRRTVSGALSVELAIAGVTRSLRALGAVRTLAVTEEFYELGRIHISAARRCGIPTVGVQHGTIFPLHLVYTLPAGQVSNSPVPDYFAAYGDYARDVLSSHGAFPAERVWVVGGARFDWLVNSPPDQTAARARLGLPSDRRIVFLATQFYPWFPAVGRALLEAARAHPDCLVCIKTHPRDLPLQSYREIAAQVGVENVRLFDWGFDDLLAACDIMVSGSSTALFEAVLLCRATIMVNFTEEPDRYPYAEDGAALPARSPAELARALERLLADANSPEVMVSRKRFLARHAGPTVEGRAARTLAQHILQSHEEPLAAAG